MDKIFSGTHKRNRIVRLQVYKDDSKKPIFDGRTEVTPGGVATIDYRVQLFFSEGSEFGNAANYRVVIRKGD